MAPFAPRPRRVVPHSRTLACARVVSAAGERSCPRRCPAHASEAANNLISSALWQATSPERRRLRIILGALILASLQFGISKLQVPAWSSLAEPSLWPDTKRERVSFGCRALPCDGVSVLLGQRPLSKTRHTHQGWTESFQSGHA